MNLDIYSKLHDQQIDIHRVTLLYRVTLPYRDPLLYCVTLLDLMNIYLNNVFHFLAGSWKYYWKER